MKVKSFLVSCVIALSFSAAPPVPAGQLVPPVVQVYVTATTPSNGTNAVQRLTFDNNITGGSFRLSLNGSQSGTVIWSATDATLKSRVLNALNMITVLGVNGTSDAGSGTLSGGHGTFDVLCSGSRNRHMNVPLLQVANNSLVGSTHTLTATQQTVGVTADARNSRTGSLCVALDSFNIYVNKGEPGSPDWTLALEGP